MSTSGGAMPGDVVSLRPFYNTGKGRAPDGKEVGNDEAIATMTVAEVLTTRKRQRRRLVVPWSRVRSRIGPI